MGDAMVTSDRFLLLTFSDGRQVVIAEACWAEDQDGANPPMDVTPLEPHPDLSCLCWRHVKP